MFRESKNNVGIILRLVAKKEFNHEIKFNTVLSEMLNGLQYEKPCPSVTLFSKKAQSKMSICLF